MNKLSSAVRRQKGKREWVKNAIIVFLVILLLLTFFSGTIMNYSLPEVAAQYPMSTTITTKIRGNGTVEAAQSYHVTVEETREVAAVHVKVGDTVSAGQTLLTLEETESEELTAARDTYNALKLEYDKLTIQRGEQNNVDNQTLSQAQAAVTQAQSDLSKAQTYEANLKWYQDAENSARSTLSGWTAAQASAQAKVESLQTQIQNAPNTNADYLAAVNTYGPDSEEAINIYNSEIAPTVAYLTTQLNDAQSALETANSSVASAQAAYEAAQSATSNFQSQNTDATSVSAAQSALQAAQDSLAALQAAAADAAVQKEYDDAVAALDLEAKKTELEEAQKKVTELEKKAAQSTVVSKYSGVVTEIDIAAGTKTVPEETLMIVELSDKGYTLKSTVNKTQARFLSEGMDAEITNLWNSGISMKLTNIMADPSDPANSRTLIFQVTGDEVTVGQQLSYSVGNKSANYDVVVPSAAVHTDADGSFVYAVTVKFSPLGNRYSVKKCAVDVLASDDSNSAISGAVSTSDFIITTATTPLEPGMKIRIAE